MVFHQGMAPLRDVLADLYPGAAEARTVLAAAGIDSRRIDFSGSALVRWQAILDEADKLDALQALVDQARREYPTNPYLEEAERHVHATPRPAAGAGEELHESGGNVSISVGGDNRGVIAGGDIRGSRIIQSGDRASDASPGADEDMHGATQAEDENPRGASQP